MKQANITLPHETSEIFLTDGGLETTLIYLDGIELPCFASFDLLKDEDGINCLKNYYRRYLDIAKSFDTGFILEGATWRANPDWIEKVGYSKNSIFQLNRKAVELMRDVSTEYENDIRSMVISGCIGPRGDGYVADQTMTADEAQQYHAEQIAILGEAGVDVLSAMTMNYVEEAIGIARAAEEVELPVVISFTVETDGKLPTGMLLKDAVAKVENSVSQKPIYYMINCAHPTHFLEMLLPEKDEEWTKRIRGVRSNASCKSHAELDASTELDRGDIALLGSTHHQLKTALPHLNVFGGCCGTDHEHVLEIARTVVGELVR